MAKHWIQDATDEMEKKGTKGAFSSWAANHDMSTPEAARKVMSHKDRYSKSRVKQANFARNVEK